jgi:uncharacterized protein (TIGR03435 family)
MSARNFLSSTLAVAVFALHAHGQTFEVASIKRNPGVDARQGSRVLPGGRIELTNMPLRTLIRIAYGSTGAQIVGGPGWVASDGYDVVAKVTGDPAVALKALLEERFHLQVHTEKREAQAYALVLANKDGKLGPELTPSHADCTPGPSSPCGIRGGNGDVTYTGLAIPQIATSLAGFPAVRSPVADRTGLTGRYDLHLIYGSEPSDTAPNLFTAIVEQAGLKLQPEKSLVDFIVVDRAERPEEN